MKQICKNLCMILAMLLSLLPTSCFLTSCGQGTTGSVPTPVPSSELLEGICTIPRSQEDLKAAVLASKRYDTSYLPDRNTEEVGVYLDENTAVYLRRISFSEGNDAVTAYIADVYVDRIDQLFGAVLTDEEGKIVNGSPEDVLKTTDALLLLNSDYVRARSWGLYVRNGRIYRNEAITGIDVCTIGKSGKMEIYDGDTVSKEALLKDSNLWHIFSFGPSLLNEDGSARDEDSQFHITDRYSRWNQYDSSVGFPVPNPRTAIGQSEDGHFILAAVDGRKKGTSRGMNFPELSHLMYEEGASVAYNLDGGGSVLMYLDGKKVNNTGGNIRTPSDYLCIVKKTEGADGE